MVVQEGDWFVEYDWKYRVRCAIRVTAKMVFYIDDEWGKRKHRVQLDRVVFSTRDITLARRVADQLTSSDALCEQERREANLRHIARKNTIISEAMVTAQDSQTLSPLVTQNTSTE